MDVQEKTGKFTGKAAGPALLTLAAALALWLFLAAGYRKEAIGHISKSLITINSYKVYQIAAWREEHSREALRLSRHTVFGELVAEEIARPGSRRAQLTHWLKDQLIQKQYTSLAFLTPKGAVVAATPGFETGTEKYFKEIFTQAAREGTGLLTDLYLASDGRPRAAMIIPMRIGGRGGKPVTVLVINIDPERKFYPIVKASPQFFDSAETLLVRKEGERALYLSPLVHAGNAALKYVRPLYEDKLPAAAAIRGTRGFFTGVDYRGVKVFSAISHIENSGWAVVTKIDRDEVLAPVKTRERLALALVLLGAVSGYGLFYLILRRRELAAREAIYRAEEGLRESERIFREFMEHSPVYVFFKDKDLRALRLSRNYEALLGRPLKELLGRSMDDLFPSDLAKSMIEDDKRIIREGKEVTVEEEFNGRSYRTIKFPILTEGKPPYLAGYTLDVTGQKRAEEQLKEREAGLSRAQELAKLGGWRRAFSGPIEWSAETYRIYGVSPETFTPTIESLTALIQPDDRPRMQEWLRACAAGENPGALIFRAVRPDGAVRVLEGRGELVSGPGGKPGYMSGTVQDITERRQAEQKLQESETRYRALVEASGDGLLTADLETMRFRFANRAICRMLGYTAEELTALSVADIHPKEALPAVIAEFEAQARGEKTLAPGLPCLRKDGTVFYADITTTPVTVDGRRCNLGIFRDITERRRIEEALQESAAKLELTIDEAPVCVAMVGTDKRFLRSNKAFTAFLGYSEAEMIGKTIREITYPEDAEIGMPELRAILAGESRGATFQKRYVRKDGAVVWGEVNIKLIRNARGKPLYVLPIIQDITARKEAEEELRKTADDFRTTLENLLVGVVAHAADTGIISCNPEAQRILGLSEDRMLGRKAMDPAWMFVHEDLSPMGLEDYPVTQVIREKVPFTNRVIGLRRPDRNYITWVNAGGTPIFAAGGALDRVIINFIDITARKEAEDALRESERLLRESQSRARLGSYALDINTGLWKCSAILEEIFGISAEYPHTVEGWEALVHPDDRAMMSAYLRDEVIGRKQAFEKEYRIVRQDSRAWRWVRGLGGLEFDDHGNPVKMHGTIQDIHERKLAELELERLNRDLVAKRREMENFLYITTHDLRSPLVNIQGFAQNLERYLRELREELAPGRFPQPVSEAVSTLTFKEIPGALKFILESSNKMDSLISSLLKVARLGRVEMKPQPLEMNDLVKKILDATRYQLEEAGASAKAGLLPPCEADPVAVSQILSNLLENAIKYRSADRPLDITITGETAGARVLYKVADNGSGIAARDLDRIWDIFYRGSAPRAGAGEGIGLTVVKYMAEKSGGSVRAESEEGRGTVFHLELPAAGGAK